MKQSPLFPNTPNTPNTQKTPDTLNVFQGLNRSEVEPLAFKILRVVEPFCLKAEVAGSLRRRHDVVNDVDIVVLPRPERNCWLNIVKMVRTEFDGITVKQGDKLAVLNVPFFRNSPGYVQVDLYRADPGTWGILLLVRTGSKEHNVKLCNLAISKGLRLLFSVGLSDQSGRVVAGRTEEEVFSALGLAFVEPKDREVS